MSKRSARRMSTRFGSVVWGLQPQCERDFIRKGEHWAHVPNEINLEICGVSTRLDWTSRSPTLIHEGCPNRDTFVMEGDCTLPPAPRFLESIRRCHPMGDPGIGFALSQFCGRLGALEPVQGLGFGPQGSTPRRSVGFDALQVAYQVYMLAAPALNGPCIDACPCISVASTFGWWR